jgi:hypothetical protein
MKHEVIIVLSFKVRSHRTRRNWGTVNQARDCTRNVLTASLTVERCRTVVLNSQSASLLSDTYNLNPILRREKVVAAHPISGPKLRQARLCSINVMSRNFRSRKLNSLYCRILERETKTGSLAWKFVMKQIMFAVLCIHKKLVCSTKLTASRLDELAPRLQGVIAGRRARSVNCFAQCISDPSSTWNYKVTKNRQESSCLFWVFTNQADSALDCSHFQ